MHQPNIMKERYGQEQYKNLSENKKIRSLSIERDTIKRKKTKNFDKHLKWYLSYQFFEKNIRNSVSLIIVFFSNLLECVVLS